MTGPALMCGSGLLAVLVLFVLLLALAGLIILLLKLGVIFHYATKQEPEGQSSEYSLEQSKEV